MDVGFEIEEMDDQIKTMISTYHAGSVTLFNQNMKTPQQVATLINSFQDLGQKNDKELVYQTANRNGKELATMGFNVDFTPVLDLSDTDTRSYGTDQQKAAEFGEAAVS